MISTHFQPSARIVVGLAFQLRGRQPVEQRGIGQIALMFLVEQVAQHVPARRLVGLDADNSATRRSSAFDMRCGQHGGG